MPSTPRPNTSATTSAERRSAPTSGSRTGAAGPGAAPALELALENDVLLPTVDSRVVPSLVMVVTTGTVVAADEEAGEDDDVAPDEDSVDEEEVLAVAAEAEMVEDPSVVSMVLPSLTVVETTGTVVAETEAAVPVATTEEKTPRALRVVPEAEAWAGEGWGMKA